MLVTSSDDHTARLWDVQHGDCLEERQGRSDMSGMWIVLVVLVLKEVEHANEHKEPLSLSTNK